MGVMHDENGTTDCQSACIYTSNIPSSYAQQAGGKTLEAPAVEITYGMERILMSLQVREEADMRHLLPQKENNFIWVY